MIPRPLPFFFTAAALLALAACVPALPGSKLEEMSTGGTGGASAGSTGMAASGGATGMGAVAGNPTAGSKAGTTGAAAAAAGGAGAGGKGGGVGGSMVVGSGGTAGTPPPPYIVLAESSGSPRNIAVDGKFVYWANREGRTLLRVPVEGGPLSALAPVNSPNAWVALDGESVFWSDGLPDGPATQIFKMVLTGGAPTLVVSNNAGAVNEIAASADGVFWTMNDGRVVKVARSGGGPSVLASGLRNPAAITVDASNVYWVTDDGFVMKVGIGGASQLTISAWPPPSDPINPGTPFQQLPNVAVDATSVYFGKLNGPVMKANLTGSPPAFAFAWGNGRAFTSMAADAKGVYAGDALGIVHYRTVASPDIEWTVGDHDGAVTAIATDAANVYWAVAGTAGGRILKAPR